MQLMILAAGLGTRMRPLSKARPKCLMPLFNRPLLDWWLCEAKAQGITRVIINTHYLAEAVRAFMARRSAAWPELFESHEPVLLGSGGALPAARRFMDDQPFALLNADFVAKGNWPALFKLQKQSNALGVMAVTSCPDINTVSVDENDNILGFRRSPAFSRARSLAYAGLAVFSPKLFAFLPEQGPAGLIEALEKALAGGLKIKAWTLPGYWGEMGTPEGLWQAHHKLRYDPPPELSELAVTQDLTAAPDALVEPGAETSGLVVAGSGAVLHKGCRVSNALIFPGAQVLPGAVVENAVLGDGVQVQGLIRKQALA